ncbi:unnamed protein product [Bursaphelenchus xylophilus]|uniref:(pine wood nematode) hypothetical protein n=1 Tax=Bursaphelenchus xylophilus TaxID=6326 RepID=A0A1I7RM85_BURXY|nr:unnamed protein product [Bursaphelenchus xylophilus]CAG9118290.1 unnamed protein product [Bursaphelenchus xylophilus]
MFFLSLLACLQFIGLASSAKFSASLQKLGSSIDLQGNFDSKHPVYDYLEDEYCVTVAIGTPPKEYNLVVDTSSDVSWVPHVECGEGPKGCQPWCKEKPCNFFCIKECCIPEEQRDKGCLRKKKYNPKDSETYEKSSTDFSFNTSIGRVQGFYGKDNWTLGISSGEPLSVDGFKFGLVTTLGQKYNKSAFDGVLGLSRSRNPKSFAVQAIESGLLDEPLMSLHFKFGGYDKHGRLGGALTLGGLDHDNCGFVKSWIPVEDNAAWIFKIDRPVLNGHPLKGALALSDTSSAYLHGPFEWIYPFARGIGADYVTNKDIWVTGCDANFTVTFDIGKHTYNLPWESLVQEVSPDHCELMVKATGYTPYTWVLGAPFAQAYCHVYDFEKGRIGFAEILK